MLDDLELLWACWLAWLAMSCWLLFYLRKRGNSIGLPLVYLGMYTIIHCGAVVYLIPWYDPKQNAMLAASGTNLHVVAVGSLASTIGLLGFCVGLFGFDLMFAKRFQFRINRSIDAESFARRVLLCGVAFFAILFPLGKSIPGATALTSAGVYLFVVGMSLFLWNALQRKKLAVILFSSIGSLTIPVITIGAIGFVGYGVAALVAILGFVLTAVRLNWRYILLAPLIIWGSMSFYITYMDSRNKIRDSVWGGESYSKRFTIVFDMLRSPQFFDPRENNHLEIVDIRLNQNTLVGQAIDYMQDNNIPYSNGESIGLAMIAWIPRAIWPDKPTFGGSSGVVSYYTGIVFTTSTSVGVGQVLEFYINFGYLGVFIGFGAIGFALRALDRLGEINLQAGNLENYVRYHLIGICLVQPQGNLAEIVASSTAAGVLVFVLSRFILKNELNKVRSKTGVGYSSFNG